MKRENHENPDILHGNAAKIDPKTHVESLYQTNLVTVSHRTKDETPISPDENVEYARKFSEKNKK